MITLYNKVSGVVLGDFDAETKDEAILMMYREAGCGHGDVWLQDGDLCFSEGFLEDFGDASDIAESKTKNN